VNEYRVNRTVNCDTMRARAANYHSHLGHLSALFTVHDLQGILDADYACRYEPYDLQAHDYKICV
jgi:hypothetical protein